MWLIYAIFSMLGITIWYIWPKFYPNIENIFSALTFSAFIYILVCPFLSKIFFDKWFDISATPLGIGSAIGGGLIGTTFMILAFRSGGKIGEVATVVELALILSAILGIFLFKESLNNWQILGILITFIGVSFVVFFGK